MTMPIWRKLFYAIENHGGAHQIFYRFPTERQRDEWVSAANHRTAIHSKVMFPGDSHDAIELQTCHVADLEAYPAEWEREMQTSRESPRSAVMAMISIVAAFVLVVVSLGFVMEWISGTSNY